MVSYPYALRKVLMPLYELFRGRKLLHYIDEYEEHLHWDAKQIEMHQWQMLQKLLKHSYETTEYYREVWSSHGLSDYRDIASMSDFAKLPVLTKGEISDNYDRLLSNKYKNNIRKSTGGSTGTPFHFELNMDSNTRREAVAWRGYGWLGAGLGQKILSLWGADIGDKGRLASLKLNLYHRFYNRKILNSFSMNLNNIHDYVGTINSYKPSAIVAYVNPLYELAKYINDNKVKVWSPRTILTGAEALYDHQRDEIERAFKCNVFNTFGCREFMLISAECVEGKNLHINTDHLVVEVLDSNLEPMYGESGDLVVTDLFNYAMPLIRYKNGDRATLEKSPCGCGNPLPIMTSVDGRSLDVIKTPSGGRIAGELFPHLFKEFRSIRKFQICQNKLDCLIVRIVPLNGFCTEDKLKIEREINRYTKGELKIIFEIVDDICLTVSGKHRVTISELN